MRFAILAAFLTLIPLGFAHAGTISVSGEGSASAEPDMATISMGVSHQSKTAQDAMDAVARDINLVLASLKDSGVEERDVQTSQISLYPVWGNADRNGNSKVTGFSASVTLSVLLRDLEKMGAVIAEVVEVGGNRFHGVSLGFQDTSELEAAARADAVRDAVEKAEQLAAAAGVEIVGITSISEGGGGMAVPLMQRSEMAMVADTMEIATGERSVGSYVSIVFEID